MEADRVVAGFLPDLGVRSAVRPGEMIASARIAPRIIRNIYYPPNKFAGNLCGASRSLTSYKMEMVQLQPQEASFEFAH